MIYKNSNRDCDIRVANKTKDEIIEILYHRLDESDKALRKIRGIVGSSFGTKDISDYNSEILNPLWITFNESNN